MTNSDGVPFPPWPPRTPFPASRTDSTGSGTPDFPSSAADRERARFRPSVTPKLDQVAVSDDSGAPVGSSTNRAISEEVVLMRAVVLGLEMLLSQYGEYVDLRREVSRMSDAL